MLPLPSQQLNQRRNFHPSQLVKEKAGEDAVVVEAEDVEAVEEEEVVAGAEAVEEAAVVEEDVDMLARMMS